MSTIIDRIESRKGTLRGVPYVGDVLKGHQAQVSAGVSIRLFGVNHNHVNGPQAFDLTFKVGDEAVYGTYNFIYTGVIVSITTKTVTIVGDGGKPHRLDLYKFSRRNHNFNAAKTLTHNAEVLASV